MTKKGKKSILGEGGELFGGDFSGLKTWRFPRILPLSSAQPIGQRGRRKENASASLRKGGTHKIYRDEDPAEF